jgi:hypothetical protein
MGFELKYLPGTFEKTRHVHELIGRIINLASRATAR